MKNSKTFLLLAILLVCVYTATFDIKSVSICTQQSSQGFCTRWEQNGSVQETTGCFPPYTEVYALENGDVITKKLEEVQIGDQILSQVNGQEQFSEVRGWLHKNKTMDLTYFKIETETGSFVSSAFHNIGLIDGTYSYAKDLHNQFLSNGEKVIRVTTKQDTGVYTPFTDNGNFFISLNNQKKTLVHCFANIKNPDFYMPFVRPIFIGW